MVTLEFAVRGSPPHQGSIRTFVCCAQRLVVQGLTRTRRNAARTVERLPFRAMTAYPYPDGGEYPDDPAQSAVSTARRGTRATGRATDP